ncbi:beta-glucosidase 17-like isoform X2 [Castanea sativa]|uniref:beta-glucosidase 17-like isoform X2 n=1 Tax=Castanea sativa TaxID=21020 RepID=UPI003F65245C
MEILHYHLHHLFWYVLLVVAYFFSFTESISRRDFPAGFIFGGASSAYQYEGAAFEHGKGPSIWDTFTMEHPEKIADHTTGDIADEFYYRFKGDIALMKEIGLDFFRISISWTRILPKGKISGGVNQRGITFYNNLINHLLSQGLKPFITLFHWDVPQALEEEYGGFLSQNIVNDYRNYVDVCFKEFGDRVKYWVTINEPNIFTIGGYVTGVDAPGRCSNYVGNCTYGNSGTEPYIVGHNLLLSHAIAVKLYREKYQASQTGEIGISIQSLWYLPKYQTVASTKAALRAQDFMLGWFVDPIIFGDYPETMRALVGTRLPVFTESQSKMLKGSLDFLGINYYTARYADDSTSSSSINLSYTTDSHVNLTTEKDGIPIGQSTATSWLYIYPRGIRELMLYIKKKYNNPPIYITENGVADNGSSPIQEALNDCLKIKYYYSHLSNLLEAIRAGVDVRGYFVWSFLDDFEWDSGYTIRFGIIYVDYENRLTRYMKRSAFWFKNFLRKENENVIRSKPLLYLSSN